MLNFVWPFFIILSCTYGIFAGKVSDMNTNIFSSAEDAVKLSITFLGTISLWNGIMKILNSTSIMQKLTKLLSPIVLFLFPEMKKEEEGIKLISMNIVANLLGIGNAATPIGIKAMKEMQNNNKRKDTLSNSMIMFIVINTASIQIIPTTIIAIRSSLGAHNPTQVIVPIWIASICAVTTVIIVTKLLIKLEKRERR